MREWGPFPGGVPDPNRSGLFEYLNAGKYGTTVDLEADASAASRLIADAHVLVEALGPGMLDRLGLGVRVLEALRPGLVVVRISDFGHRGPLRDRVATPLTVQAASGWINTRDPDRPPVQAGARISEYVAGGYGALGALTALRTLSSNTTASRRGGRVGAGVAAVDASVPDADGREDAKPRHACHHQIRADDGDRPRRGRLDRDQLPDRAALARCVRDARSA